MVRYPNDKLVHLWEATGGNKPTDDISDLHEWAATRIAELEQAVRAAATAIGNAQDRITELEAEIAERRMDYGEDCKRLDARIAELEQQLKAMQQIIDGYKDDLKQQKPDRVLLALQLAYRKHHLLDDSVGSTELSDCLCDAICELIGNDGFQSWLGAMEDAGNDNDIFVED